MSQIIVCPLHDVAALISVRQPSHVLSLLSPSMAKEAIDTPYPVEHLTLRFHDIPEPRPDLIAPDHQVVRKMLDFITQWPGNAPLLIHCWAGVSRSTAAAYITACQRSCVGHELALAQDLRGKAPYATPNSLLVQLADDLLGRQGAMVSAVQSIGRGCDTAWGSGFALRV